jgi:hypothetical protein
MLRELFERQAELNKRIGFDPAKLREHFDPQVAGEWLHNYVIAASNELEELRNCTYWKHWCAEAKAGRRFELHDLQNARVEVIDLLFFWISMAQCVGLDADDVMELYHKKLEVNHRRQDTGYAMATKTEADNKGIRLERKRRSDPSQSRRAGGATKRPRKKG